MLYPEREKFLSVIKTECKNEFRSLVSFLCNKYSDLLKSFQGIHAYKYSGMNTSEQLQHLLRQTLQDAPNGP